MDPKSLHASRVLGRVDAMCACARTAALTARVGPQPSPSRTSRFPHCATSFLLFSRIGLGGFATDNFPHASSFSSVPLFIYIWARSDALMLIYI